MLRQYSVRPAADVPRQVLMEFHVEEPVKQITSRVRYPDKLRERGICGEVFAVFVVDTLGNADMETFRIVRSTDPLFSQAVRDGVARSRFKPARLHTRLVRQLVHQPFAFSITETSPFVTLEPRRDSLPPEPYLPHHSCLAQKR
ncbi:MAG: energy transducer TonB [Gemmatimonadaceae bacterium]